MDDKSAMRPIAKLFWTLAIIISIIIIIMIILSRNIMLGQKPFEDKYDLRRSCR